MKREISVLSILLALAVLLSACIQEPVVPTEPTTEPTAAPTAKPTEAPTTEPTEPPTTEPATEPPSEPPTEEPTVAPTIIPTEPDPAIPPEGPRQAGQRLTEEELARFEQMFTRFADEFSLSLINYYNMALSHTYQSVEEMKFSYFFNDGFADHWGAELTQEERNFYYTEIGYEITKDIYRFPADKVAWVLDYYFGKSLDEVDLGMVYNPNTDCYYQIPAGAMTYPKVDFHDGYYDEETGMIALYYNDYMKPEERVITIQSKKSVGEAGYYIVSNMVVRSWYNL